MIDPQQVTLTVFELRDGAYVQAAAVSGSEGYEAKLPFPVRIVPLDLLGRFS